MSIYASLAAPCDDHSVKCDVYVEDPPGSRCYEFTDAPCTCGLKAAPIVYEGSHVLPSDDDRREGSIDLALIPGHIEREGRPAVSEWSPPHPWLRLGIYTASSREQYEGKPYVSGGHATVVLDRRQVEQVRDTLTEWLESLSPSPSVPEPTSNRKESP